MSWALIVILFGSTIVAVAVSLVLAHRRRDTATEPTCGNCGYNLTGATENRCSECGRPFLEVGIVTTHQRSPKPRKLLILTVILANGLMALAILATALYVRQAKRAARAVIAQQQAMLAPTSQPDADVTVAESEQNGGTTSSPTMRSQPTP